MTPEPSSRSRPRSSARSCFSGSRGCSRRRGLEPDYHARARHRAGASRGRGAHHAAGSRWGRMEDDRPRKNRRRRSRAGTLPRPTSKPAAYRLIFARLTYFESRTPRVFPLSRRSSSTSASHRQHHVPSWLAPFRLLDVSRELIPLASNSYGKSGIRLVSRAANAATTSGPHVAVRRGNFEAAHVTAKLRRPADRTR